MPDAMPKRSTQSQSSQGGGRTPTTARRKHRHTVLRIVGSVLVGVLVVVMLPFCSHGCGADPAQYEHRLSVLTYNTHRMGGFRKLPQNRVLQYLLRQDADVICLQEVEVYKDNTYLTLGELKGAMREKYPYSYIDFSVYNQRRQFGNVVFSRYPLINKQTIRYTSQANISSQCDIVVGNDTLRLITNHLESNRFDQRDIADNMSSSDSIQKTFHSLSSKWERASVMRHEQARRVHEAISASPYPTIVVGDFNDLAWSYTYWRIRSTMRDCFLSSSWGRYGATYSYHHLGARIDYILCSRSLHAASCQVERVRHSDHYPVQALLVW